MIKKKIPKHLIERRAEEIRLKREPDKIGGECSDEDLREAEQYYQERYWLVRYWKLRFPIELLFQIPELLADKDKETREFGLEVIKTIISGITVIGTIIAAVALYLTYLDNLEDRRLAEKNNLLLISSIP